MSLYFVFYAPLLILVGYLFSLVYDKPEVCQSSLPGLMLMVSLLPFVAVESLHKPYPSTSVALHAAFSVLFPPYTLFGGLFFLIQFEARTDVVDRGFRVSDFFSDPEVAISFAMILVWLLLCGVALPLLDEWRERGCRGGICGWRFGKGVRAKKLVTDPEEEGEAEGESGNGAEEDSDVIQEGLTVSGLNPRDVDYPVVVVKDLVKTYEGSEDGKGEGGINTAVQGLNFAVRKGDIFGLLGPNGAGKSTTMNIVTGSDYPDSGDVFVAGHDVIRSRACNLTGYCPQYNPLYDDVRVRDHLLAFAAIRGIQGRRQINKVADQLLGKLRISAHERLRVKAISGWTKRKLCFALSLLGEPEVVVMDEPSTGMDPNSKRFLWDTINQCFQGSNRGAILTTHSMEEADALCSRIGIMVKGRLKCLGSSQHLKDKFGSGYILEVKLRPSALVTESSQKESTNRFQALLGDLFQAGEPVTETNDPSRVVVKENFGGRLVYKIPKESVSSLASVFTALERSKLDLQVEEYSFSQTTLEQVFLEFAKQQLQHSVVDHTKC